jgi:hypothetical protein
MTDTLTADVDPDRLAVLALRCQTEPLFLANALARHRERFSLTEHEQRLHLCVKAEHWSMFQLCRAPVAEQWAEDLDRIAGHFGADRGRLERALRVGGVILPGRSSLCSLGGTAIHQPHRLSA